jgi:hypothetical protein
MSSDERRTAYLALLEAERKLELAGLNEEAAAVRKLRLKLFRA